MTSQYVEGGSNIGMYADAYVLPVSNTGKLLSVEEIYANTVHEDIGYVEEMFEEVPIARAPHSSYTPTEIQYNPLGGFTDVSSLSTVTTPWDAAGVMERALNYVDPADAPSHEELNPPQVVPEVPYFGGAYESPAIPKIPEKWDSPGYDQQTVTEVPEIPWEVQNFGTVGTPPGSIPGEMPGQPVTPEIPWGVEVEDEARTVQADWFGFKFPDLSIPGFNLPGEGLVKTIAGVVTPVAGIGVEAATDPEGLAQEFGLGLGQTIAGIGGLLILVMMMKE